MISIVVPTLNEGKNIEELVTKVARVMEDKTYEMIIVDKCSQDGTGSIIEHLRGQQYPLVLFQAALDLSKSVLLGFSHAKGDDIGVMDGDLSHPPERIPDFIRKIEQDGYDLVVGTRKKGGHVEQWPLHRKLVSRLGEMIARPLIGDCSDPMSGFFFLKRKVIQGAVLEPVGYKILLEILVKGHYTKYGELPYVFRNRERGKSKLNMKEYLRYLSHLGRLYRYRIEHPGSCKAS
jgi:dolichol-phosphate mannosyltransferase